MSLGGTQVDAIDVGAILAGVDDRVVVLPDFQRPFEWTEADTIAVLATLLTRWPIGSLLLLEEAPSYLRTKPFNGVPESDFKRPPVEYVVLDGQQRITSLYHALWDRGKKVYAINLLTLESDPSPENLEDSIETIARPRWQRRYPTPERQLPQNYVPLYALKSPSDFFHWRDLALEGVDPSEREAVYDRVSRLYRQLFSGIDRYRVPAIIVPKKTPPGAIARIFERVNKSGMKLSTFDLMVAIAYDGEFNLRTEWNRARLDTYPLVGDFFGDDGMFALHAMSLMKSQSLRDSAVIQMKGETVRGAWDEAIQALDNAAVFARKHLGINKVSEAPSNNSILVIAGLSKRISLERHAKQIVRWFWATAFGGRYNVASNTTAVSDYRELLEERHKIAPFALVKDDLLTSTKRQRSGFHRSFAAFTASMLSGPYQSSISGLAFASVLADGSTAGDLRDATLTFAWQELTVGADESTEAEVVDPTVQLLDNGPWPNPSELVESRLNGLAEALRQIDLQVVVVQSSEEATDLA